MHRLEERCEARRPHRRDPECVLGCLQARCKVETLGLPGYRGGQPARKPVDVGLLECPRAVEPVKSRAEDLPTNVERAAEAVEVDDCRLVPVVSIYVPEGRHVRPPFVPPQPLVFLLALPSQTEDIEEHVLGPHVQELDPDPVAGRSVRGGPLEPIDARPDIPMLRLASSWERWSGVDTQARGMSKEPT